MKFKNWAAEYDEIQKLRKERPDNHESWWLGLLTDWIAPKIWYVI